MGVPLNHPHYASDFPLQTIHFGDFAYGKLHMFPMFPCSFCQQLGASPRTMERGNACLSRLGSSVCVCVCACVCVWVGAKPSKKGSLDSHSFSSQKNKQIDEKL